MHQRRVHRSTGEGGAEGLHSDDLKGHGDEPNRNEVPGIRTCGSCPVPACHELKRDLRVRFDSFEDVELAIELAAVDFVEECLREDNTGAWVPVRVSETSSTSPLRASRLRLLTIMTKVLKMHVKCTDGPPWLHSSSSSLPESRRWSSSPPVTASSQPSMMGPVGQYRTCMCTDKQKRREEAE